MATNTYEVNALKLSMIQFCCVPACAGLRIASSSGRRDAEPPSVELLPTVLCRLTPGLDRVEAFYCWDMYPISSFI